MMNSELMKKTLIAAMAAAALGLAGCQADGSGTESGSIISDGGGSAPPLNNDGSTPTDIDTNGDGTVDGNDTAGNFVCTQGARAFGDVTTADASGGLLGGPLTTLINGLGGDPVTALTNGVSEPDNVVDGHLSTYATFTLPASLLGALVAAVGEVVNFPGAVPAGNYAVFGVTFPAGVLNLGLTKTVTVSTFLGTTLQESITVNQANLDLLGISLAGDQSGYIGLKATKKYDSAVISLYSSLVSAQVGDAMHVHELCTGGKFVSP
ncbi:hypothetical protein SAMN04488038_103145 [Solimonas aquatica]|uniref:CHRD domain-containing protein n=2 Tax=Solimonas aquatica TaxID=489703 RepID=A0A1H9CR23_9GAMM|nr:hypothetical protein SAMN04488038_103145 [Solimonas aquatica]